MSDQAGTEGGPRRETAGGDELTAEQLLAARRVSFHQEGAPLTTIEAAREWLGRAGLVLYAPRAGGLGAPAPTLVEATLGRASDAVELPEFETARTLLARLVAEGAAVPLNLMGAPGGLGTDVPDFVVSAPVFSYIFTLRGNKAWKQPPVTAGPVKVSPLALAVYEMLGAKVTLSSYDLATQLGKEVTEGAVLRALTELWGQLRVLPVPQANGAVTQWELATARFAKQIKSGANAGQPTALSALISLYLGQVTAATEEEIESFLSPLAPRSRVRDVLHALLPARQLATFVIDGRTLLHVVGAVPAVARSMPPVVATEMDPATGEVPPTARIKTWAAKPGAKIGTGLRIRPAGAGAPPAGKSFGRRAPTGGKPPFRARPESGAGRFTGKVSGAGGGPGGGSGDRERRPFDRAGKPGPGAKPRFNKPWEEDRASRPPALADGVDLAASAADAGTPGPSIRPRATRPAGPGSGQRKTFSKPGTFGRKRDASGAPGAAEGRRPPAGERKGAPRPPMTGGAPRAGDAAGAEAPRKVFRKFDAPRGTGRRPFAGPAGGGETGSSAPRGPRPGFAARPGTRSDRSGTRPDRSGTRPDRLGARPDRAAGARPPRPGAPDSRAPRPFRPGGSPFAGDRPRPPLRSGSAGSADRAASARPDARRPPSKAAQFASGGGPFAKFAGGKKPFRKPGPGKAAGGSSSKRSGPAGGLQPTKRKPEAESE